MTQCMGPAIHQGFWNLTEPELMKSLKGSQVGNDEAIKTDV